MAQYRNRAGQSTREMARKRRESAFSIGIGTLLLALVIYLLINNQYLFGIGGGGVLILLIILRMLPDWMGKRIDNKFKEERMAIRGARGEEKVGDLLSELSEGYSIIHDVVSPYGNIDHIVIGKDAGVFLLETKAHGGKISLDGTTLLLNGHLPEKDFISQTIRNAYWLREEIGKITGEKPWITPVLVFTNAFVPGMPPVKGITIINKRYLLQKIKNERHPNSASKKVWEMRETIEQRLFSA